MTVENMTIRPKEPDVASLTTNSAGGIFATLGVASGFGAVLACSCCVLPLLLSGVGVGTWVFGMLEALEPVRIPLLALSVLTVAGAWFVYFRRQPVTCLPGSTGEVPRRSGITLALLGLGSILAMTAAGWGFIEPVVLKLMQAV
jgi:mercuric ion transport protein